MQVGLIGFADFDLDLSGGKIFWANNDLHGNAHEVGIFQFDTQPVRPIIEKGFDACFLEPGV